MPRTGYEIGSAFAADWLRRREPVDHRSRAAALTPLLQAAWRARGWSRILDLGCGTGSNLRYLAPSLPGLQEWTLLDQDPELLTRVEAPAGVERVDRVHGDLAEQGLPAITQAHLVTGSALLDLVSEDWLRRLVKACRSAPCGAHFALSYDGEITWSASEGDSARDDNPDDTLVRQAVNEHQRRDKGLGPALGPTVGSVAETLFQRAGYRTWLLPSPWRLGPEDAELSRALVDGWERAAVEQQPDQIDRIQTWARRRRETIASGAFALTIGHKDLLAVPAAPV